MRTTANILLFSLSFFYLFLPIQPGIITSLADNSPNFYNIQPNKKNIDNTKIYSLTYFSVEMIQDNLIISEVQSIDGLPKQGAFDQVISFLAIGNNHNQQQMKQNISLNKMQNNYTDQNKQDYKIIEDQPLPQENSPSDQIYLIQHTQEKIQTKQSTSLTTMNRSKQIVEDQPMKILNDYIGNKLFIIHQLTPYEKIFPNYEKKIVSRQFSNLGLYNNIPLTFVDGQIYQFSGVVTDNVLIQQKKQRVNIVLLGRNNKNQILCTSQELFTVEFNISCQMRGIGVYYMYVFVGASGNYSSQERKIIANSNLIKPDFLEPEQPQPKGLRLQFYNNNLYAVWDSKASLTNLTIYQEKDGGIIKKQYLLSNKHEKFKIPFKDFNYFAPKTTYIQISHAKSMSHSLQIVFTKFTSIKDRISFQAIDHHYDLVEPSVNITPELPWRIKVGQKFQFNLTVDVDIKSIVYLTQPDFKFRKIQIITEQIQDKNNVIAGPEIKAGVLLSLQFTFMKTGAYIIQVNNIFGIAVINRPIYVGPGFPLIPDFKDMSSKFSLAGSNLALAQLYQKYYIRTTQQLKIREPNKNESLQKKRQYLLVLTNGLRKKFHVPPLYIDETLNKISQNHSDDMVLRGYFGHKNPDGQRVGQRAKRFKYFYSVGENLAEAGTLIGVHLLLQRSAGHLQNSINNKWARVGIGISNTKTNTYSVAFTFSVRDLQKFPFSKEEEKNVRLSLVAVIKQNNPKIIRQNQALSQDIKQWMLTDRTVSIGQYLIKKRGFKAYIGFSFRMPYSSDWIDIVRSSGVFKGYQKYNQYSQVGVGVIFKAQQGGLMLFYFVFSG